MTVEQWLDNDLLGIDIWNKKYRYNNESLDEWIYRVSGGDPEIMRLISEKKFLFAGRTLTNRGTNRGSYANCYSRGYVQDSLEDIMQTCRDIALTYKAQGGQGLSLSKIRPVGSIIQSNGFTSDGIVPFMKLFNEVTRTISQGGSRKGALLMSLDIWHPEIKNFITIKSHTGEIDKANLSVEIDNSFMKCIQDYLETGYSATLTIKNDFGEYQVNPVEIFKLICEQAWEHAEPGIIFTDQFRNYNIMEYVPSYQIDTGNPCGEQPLPKNGACNLSSINLSQYVIYPFTPEAKIDIESLKADIPYIVKAMDDIITDNLDNHALGEQSNMSFKFRNIGIGIMGIADMFVKLGLTYGSQESIDVLKSIQKIIFQESVAASVELAKRKGSFPGYDSRVWDSRIMKYSLTSRALKEFKEIDKLRNCSLLSIAPAGSIGTMLGVSTGIEPFFALEYNRKTESLHGKDQYYKVEIKALKEYKNITGNTDIPSYFVTSHNIHWNDRINMQAAAQLHTDTAISSTVNLPKDFPKDDIIKLYYNAWNAGLKGVTIYREGSIPAILSTGSKDTGSFPQHKATKRPRVLEAHTHITSSAGVKYLVVVGLLEGKPYEVFVGEAPDNKCEGTSIVKVKKEQYRLINSNKEVIIDNLVELPSNELVRSMSYSTSMLLRTGATLPYVIKTIKKVNPNITSFGSALSRVLNKYVKPEEDITEVCPKCGLTLQRIGGCKECTCGHSVCLLCAVRN